MKKVIMNDAYKRFLNYTESSAWRGKRIKDVRHQPVKPGGRAVATLFEQVRGDDRPHPRFRLSMPPASDPMPPKSPLFVPPSQPPTSIAELKNALKSAFDDAMARVSADNIPAEKLPSRSIHYFRNSIRAQRLQKMTEEARAAVNEWIRNNHISLREREPARLLLEEMIDELYAGIMIYDNDDTGTYHSYGHDAPFVHYLEQILQSLPADDHEGFSLLTPDQKESVRRQKEQAQVHLDYLMRHKYAYDGIDETDIEQTLGGLLVCRDTRNRVSEVPESQNSLAPKYELLRIDPGCGHTNAGSYVYRDQNTLRLQDGTSTTVTNEHLRRIPITADRLTFVRAPKDHRLRRGVRFDWDGNGYVQQNRIGWVSWAGHCDIKAILEQLGVVLNDSPQVTEYRTDAGTTTVFGRDLLLEMVASVLELGSRYRKQDGSGVVERGIHLFGGARNDSLPDRIQFLGLGPGKSFRWPLSRREEAFQIQTLTEGSQNIPIDQAFWRYVVKAEPPEFSPNPRFLKIIEGDYHLIDISKMKLVAKSKLDDFDETTGYLTEKEETITLDLSAGNTAGRSYLGTSVKDAAARTLYKVYLDYKTRVIVAELFRYEKNGPKFAPVPVPQENVTIPLVWPISCTASREGRQDDPEMFQTLLNIAIKQAQNINADTHATSEVWNGTVTKIERRKISTHPEKRMERWQVQVEARFGQGTLDYIVERDQNGKPIAYAPVPNPTTTTAIPDFLWQDFPDVGSKAKEGGDWLVNDTMLARGLVTVKRQASAPGGIYVYDDHIKNIYELIYCGMAGYRYTVVHDNKRYGFKTEAGFKTAVTRLKNLRSKLSYQG